MRININPLSYFIFDLDDTLIYEVDFLESAFRSISKKLEPYIGKSVFEEMMCRFHERANVFEWLVSRYKAVLPDLNVGWLLNAYHEHYPQLSPREDALQFLFRLKECGIPMGVLTDGKGMRQRNKLEAAGITHLFKDIIISEEFGSEKPDERNYLYFLAKYPERNFCMVGDNTNKDFIVPQKLGWKTICVKDCGKHIHAQTFSRKTLPDYIIQSFDELELEFMELTTAY